MPKERLTIDDINIVTENEHKKFPKKDINIVMAMNTSQMAVQQQEDTTTSQPLTHSYNLMERLTKPVS